MSPVALGDARHGERPADSERGIGRIQASFRLRDVGGRVQVDQFAVVAQGLEAVSEPARDEDAVTVVCRQPLGMPLQKGPGAASQIDGDVVDLAAYAADDLALAVRRMLEVKAPDRA